VEVYLLSSRATTIEVKKQKIDAFVSSSSRGVGLRVFVEKRIGFSYTALTDGSEIDALIRNAVDSAQFTEPDPGNLLPEPALLPPDDLKLHDPALAGISEPEKIDRAMALEQAALSVDPRIRVIRKAVTRDSDYTVHLFNSNGVDCSYGATGCSASIMLMADDGTHQEMGWDSDFNRFFSGLVVTDIGQRAARKALDLLGARAMQTRKVPVLFTPLTAVSFLEVFASAFSADAVQKGKSLFADRIGEVVGSERIHLVDDGHLPGGAGSAPVDDEGVPMQRKVLIRKGILEGFLHNTYTAAKEGVLSTGNGVRGGYGSLPRVGTTNLFIQRGDRSEEQLLHEMDQGLLVTEVMGMHTANPYSGDFSVGVSGFWVENGRPAYPVRGGALAGNFLEILKQVRAVGENLRFYGAVGSPSLLIDALSVSGK